ncbi:MAG: hypothetical protein BJ554DRAFT_5562 [Olpidium bornovanus]|uniref:Uncharacterized protein n=1 Tax=Olpidium bornovanus TaxID=278681 RepID=A0A8H8DKY4_9FUNG|nr:MAG: hypothetical protein BJ554DRAFT_5562 [Olpidium bornovanus]
MCAGRLPLIRTARCLWHFGWEKNFQTGHLQVSIRRLEANSRPGNLRPFREFFSREIPRGDQRGLDRTKPIVTSEVPNLRNALSGDCISRV